MQDEPDAGLQAWQQGHAQAVPTTLSVRCSHLRGEMDVCGGFQVRGGSRGGLLANGSCAPRLICPHAARRTSPSTLRLPTAASPPRCAPPPAAPPHTQVTCHCAACALLPPAQRLFAAGSFEAHAGRAQCKKWKESIKCVPGCPDHFAQPQPRCVHDLALLCTI